MSDDAIRARAKRGNIYRVFWGVYSVGAPARTPIEFASAAVLACGERSTLGLKSALAHWGVIRYWPRRPQVLTPRRCKIKGIDIRRRTDLKRSEVTTHNGITTTTVARTLLDTAPMLTAKQFDRAVTTALLQRLVTTERLKAICEKHPDHPGAPLLEPFWNTSDGPPRSDWERTLKGFRAEFGFTTMIINTEVNGREADAYIPDAQLVIELDGWINHRTPEPFEDDREKDTNNLDADIETVRLTWKRYKANRAKEAARIHRIANRRRKYFELLSRA